MQGGEKGGKEEREGRRAPHTEKIVKDDIHFFRGEVGG